MSKTVVMTETTDGSPDGATVNRYYEDHTYDLPDRLANLFVESGAARLENEGEEGEEEADPHERETKPLEPSETKPETPDETKGEADEEETEGPSLPAGVEVVPTKEGSPWYEIHVDGEPILDGDDEPMTVLGEASARERATNEFAPDEE